MTEYIIAIKQLQEIRHCMFKDARRTDLGCLHCAFSMKIGGVWTCWYKPGGCGGMSFGEGNLHERVETLERENADLREERDTYRDLVGMMDHPDLNAQLSAEIAALRGSCTMTCTYRGEPCSDWTCSFCGKTHVVHNAARVGEYCPRCGAKVAEVVPNGE